MYITREREYDHAPLTGDAHARLLDSWAPAVTLPESEAIMMSHVYHRRRAPLSVLIAIAVVCTVLSGSTLAQGLIEGTWSSLDAAVPSPSPRREYAAFYDRNNERYIIFAGFGDQPGGGYYLLNEVWALTLSGVPSWSLLAIGGTSPGQRASAQWGYDPARNRILIFGGYGRHYPGDPLAYLNDVWELPLDENPLAWNEIIPIGTPPVGRLAGSAVYDVFRQRFIGFGGTRGLPVDTWQLDLSDEPTWSTVPTDGAGPPGSYGMAAIFDAARNRMVIFGGSTSDAYLGTHNDTWELRLTPARPLWRKLNPDGPLPVARRTLASVFDPLRNRMVIFGGWDGTNNPDCFLNDTWALSLHPNDGAWTELSPAGAVPGVRDAMSAIYDPGSDRMVVFGGWSGTAMLDDTQFLTWGGAGQSASVTPIGHGEPGVVRLEWSTLGIAGPTAGVYRRQSGTKWKSIATVEADVSGIMRFDDQDVEAGGVYGYKIVLTSEVGDEFTGEVWVEVPTTTSVGPVEFRLRQSDPNPVTGRFRVSLALPSAQPAKLEMVDARGRRVFVRDVSVLGAGQHQLELGHARDYTSGVYFLRLSQLDRSETKRVVLFRAP